MNNPISLTERWKTDEIPDSAISQCSLCMNRLENDTCKAFPNGIPREIKINKVIHSSSVDGDNGIVFEPIREEYREIKFAPLEKRKLY